jgi:hypothetical protein
VKKGGCRSDNDSRKKRARLKYLLQRLSPVLNDGVGHLDVRHATGETRGGVAVRDVLEERTVRESVENFMSCGKVKDGPPVA